MTDPSKMPARIWANPANGNCVVSFKSPSLDYNVPYVRADIAEQMAEALTWALAELDKRTSYQHPGQFLACDTRARAALSAWEASNA